MRCSLILALGLALGATGTASADTVDLAPAGDTFVKAGTEAGWDHGAADQLEVEQSPAHIAYLKFDLSAVAAPVVRAKLGASIRISGHFSAEEAKAIMNSDPAVAKGVMSGTLHPYKVAFKQLCP